MLSACNSGLGKDVRGEGLVGLTRGFMYAGAASVVASLWRVDDEATAELMSHFYEALLTEGLRPPAALRQAQFAMWRQRRWRSPYFWAAFTLQGEYRLGGGAELRKRQQGVEPGVVVAAALLTSTLFLSGLRLIRRRRVPGNRRSEANSNAPDRADT